MVYLRRDMVNSGTCVEWRALPLSHVESHRVGVSGAFQGVGEMRSPHPGPSLTFVLLSAFGDWWSIELAS